MANVIKLKTGTSTPTTGDLVDKEVAIDTSAQKFYINDNGTVKEIGGGSGGGGGGSSTLSGLTDVTISSASNGQVLKYNGSAWVNDTDATGGGGGGGSTDLLEIMLFT